jgi:hypothetical protein
MRWTEKSEEKIRASEAICEAAGTPMHLRIM